MDFQIPKQMLRIPASRRWIMGVSRRLKAKIDYSDRSHPAFAQFVENVYDHLLRTDYFPKLPVSLRVVRGKLDEYQGLIIAAMDSKIARVKRDSVREELADMVRENAHHVESVADGDEVVFNASGLEAIPTRYKPPQQLWPVHIKKVAHGVISGSADLTLTPSYRRVKCYEVRLRDASDTSEDSWRIETFASANGPVTIAGLNPGTKYEFQVRGLGMMGLTNWSDSKTLICS